MSREAAIAEEAGRAFEQLRYDLGLPADLAAGAEPGRPMLVSTTTGSPSYWLVPVALGDSLVGFLRYGRDAVLMAHGRFGDADGRFPSLAGLDPAHAAAEIDLAFPAAASTRSPVVLVHDGPPERLAWMADASSGERHLRLYWSFGFSYARPADP